MHFQPCQKSVPAITRRDACVPVCRGVGDIGWSHRKHKTSQILSLAQMISLSVVLFQRRLQALHHGFLQGCRSQHFHIRPEFQNVHDQFPFIAVGDLQMITPVFVYGRHLSRMPFLAGHPACPLRGKAEFRGIRCFP